MNDTERLNWLEKHLFERRWNGVLGEGSSCHWSIRGDFRHMLRDLDGDTLRAAIDHNAKHNELVPDD